MINLFYIESYFHLLVVDQIINVNKLPIESCFFVTERGVILPKRYEKRLLYDGAQSGLLKRVELYYKKRKILKNEFGRKEICAYIPFQYFFPSKLYFTEYRFFEEGFSAYYPKEFVEDKARRRRGFLKSLFVSLLLPFSSKLIKGLISGISCDSSQLIKTKLYRLSDDAYKSLDKNSYFDVETIGIKYRDSSIYSEIHDAIVIVADRISSQGRPFFIENYLFILKQTVEILHKDLKRPLYVKLHPADYKNGSSKKIILEELSQYKPVLITENLENLAIANYDNVFVGTNSTVLYYAPILGDSNRSISFARQLAEKDTKYAEFLNGWGGIEKFIKILSNQVECL